MSKATIASLGEKALLKQLRSYVSTGDGIVRAVSEDCAVLDAGAGLYRLLTMDVLVDGEHFIGDWTPAFLLGRKAVNVNVSDISAMGGKARLFLVSLGLPPDTSVAFVEELYRGFESAAKQSNLQLAGGNLSSSRLAFIDILMEGEVSSARVLLRNGAVSGDILYVSGALGASAAGLLWLQRGYRIRDDAAVDSNGVPAPEYIARALFAHFEPPVLQREAEWLAAGGFVTSMMDLSDGLASDLPEICRESNVGAIVESSLLPIASCARQAEADPLQLALNGGEDYHLLFTVQGSRREQFERAASEARVEAHAIGSIVPAPEGIVCREPDGSFRALGCGFQHFGNKT